MIPEGGNFTSIPKDSPYYVKGMISHVYRRIHRNEPSKTIIAAGGGGTWGYHYPENRPLTNRERARIQSFPDDFIFYGNTTEVRRQIGNAVPPVGVHAIAKALKPLFLSDYPRIDLKAEQDKLMSLSFEERLKLITNDTHMEILLPSNPLIQQHIRTKSISNIFNGLVDNATDFNIATGFITNDSIAALKQIVEFREGKLNISLFIGMNYLEGFTKPQYIAVRELNNYLITNNLGAVYLSPKALYHGKMYSFMKIALA